MVRGGYFKVFLVVNRVFNITLALLILIPSLPFFLVIALCLKLQDGGEVFYRGVRLGRDKKPFTMYKFRTLPVNAEQLIGAELLPHRHKMTTRFGAFLRDTRLDELPQLINILKGDMDFVGPRPERPIIYQEMCSQIRGYDKRFSVTPGLIGFSQLFTPHSSPKEIRALIDNRFLKIDQNLAVEVGLIAYTVGKILSKTLSKAYDLLWVKIIKNKILGLRDNRELERVRQNNVVATIVPENVNGNGVVSMELVDINDEAFMVSSERELEVKRALFRLENVCSDRLPRQLKKKSAYCVGELYKTLPHDGTHCYVFKYKPTSQLNSYKVHKYFLFRSIG